MKFNIKENIYMLIVLMLSIWASFYALEGVYFVLAFPIVILAMNYKSIYLFFGMIGMLIAAFFINPSILPFLLLISFFVTYLFAHLIKRTKVPLKTYLASIASFYSFFISVGQYINSKDVGVVSVIIIPILTFYLCYHFVEFQFDLKSKENFSITKKQFVFLSTVANIIIATSFSYTEYFYLHFIVFTLFNYVIIKLDKYSGLLGILIGVILSLQYNNFKILLFLASLIFAIRHLEKKYYLGILTYLFACIMIVAYNHSYIDLIEISVVVFSMLVFPRNSLLHMHKYIIDPQDYELKLYQQGYYKTLNNNKKIQKIMGILEEYLKVNPKIKKSSRNIVLENLEFLRSKLDEEVDINFKKNILNELEYQQANILSFKLNSDLLEHYVINLECRHSEIDGESIKKIIEGYLGIRLKIKKYKYNYLLDIERFVFVNDVKLNFNVNIKQRSKDGLFCGDSYLNFTIKNKRYILISDGMGSGEKAGKDASLSLFLLKNFIELGMEPEKAIISCNALILDKEKEKFNTLDLLEYDAFNNSIQLYKNGSGVTYVKKDNEVSKIQSENLPLGIIENIKVNKINIDLNSEYIILTSDGIKKELKEMLIKSKAKSSKALTNDILQYEGNDIDDDQTIVAINVIKKN